MAPVDAVDAVKRVLIIGANRGIGFGLACGFHKKGYEVYGTFRGHTKKDESVKALKAMVKGHCFEVDFLEEESIKTAASNFGDKSLDVLINCAGVYQLWDEKPFTELSGDDLINHFKVNTVGPFLASKAFLAALSRSLQGKIINISSDFASIADNTGGNACYRISKAGVNQLTRNIAVDLKKQDSKVLALAIHPGWLATKMTGYYGEDDATTCIASIIDTIIRFGTEEGKGIENGGYVRWDGTRMDY